jgi:chemotaxis protein CheD
VRSPEGTDRLNDRIKVSIAEHAIASEGVLTTSGLGSCLGIAIYDPELPIGSLVHPMLPYRDGESSKPPERFVDSGIGVVIEALTSEGAEASSLRAKMTGGAAVVDFGSDSGESIGDRNIAAARETFDEHGIDIVGEEVGGGHGRTMRVDAATGAVTVKRTDGTDVEL